MQSEVGRACKMDEMGYLLREQCGQASEIWKSSTIDRCALLGCSCWNGCASPVGLCYEELLYTTAWLKSPPLLSLSLSL